MPAPTVVTRRTRKRRAAEAAAAQAPRPNDWSSLDPNDLSAPALFINRELSWLSFNERVLAQAQDASHPLLERVKFLAISGTNLDEFFMVRVATILKKFRAGIEEVSIDGLTTDQELATIRVARAGADRRADRRAGRSRCGRCWPPRAFTSSSPPTTRRPSTPGWRSTSRTTSSPC